MEIKDATSAINSLHHETLQSTCNKALENATRTDQLLTGHNLRIQLQEMLHSQDSKLSQISDDFEAMSGDKFHVLSFGNITELKGIRGNNMHLGEDGVGQRKAFNASLVNVKEKKLSEHQMGKQVGHSSFLAKKRNTPAASTPKMSHSDINVTVLTYPLQSVSLKSDYPLQQTNDCKLNFLNAVTGENSLDIDIGSSVNQNLSFLPPLMHAARVIVSPPKDVFEEGCTH
jgi:hypothetical protein